MSRIKEFTEEEALDAAIEVFREHGFAASTAGMLTDAMQIGRQSLYNAFGDKWRLYCLAVERYASDETQWHLHALRSGASAIEGIRNFLQRVVDVAHHASLGVGSVNEFGISRADLSAVHERAGQTLHRAVSKRIKEAMGDGAINKELDGDEVATFLLANVAAIRVAARSGASVKELQAIAALALRALG
jgi:AcrR family transcriptional regulator